MALIYSFENCWKVLQAHKQTSILKNCNMLCVKFFVFLYFPQLLHVCIEGWGNWRWSEPFSIDNVGTMLRCIHRKSQIASLIIKIHQLSGVQKQVEYSYRVHCIKYVVCHVYMWFVGICCRVTSNVNLHSIIL